MRVYHFFSPKNLGAWNAKKDWCVGHYKGFTFNVLRFQKWSPPLRVWVPLEKRDHLVMKIETRGRQKKKCNRKRPFRWWKKVVWQWDLKKKLFLIGVNEEKGKMKWELVQKEANMVWNCMKQGTWHEIKNQVIWCLKEISSYIHFILLNIIIYITIQKKLIFCLTKNMPACDFCFMTMVFSKCL